MRLGEVLNKIFRKREPKEITERKPAEDIYQPTQEEVGEEERFERITENIVKEQKSGRISDADKQRKRNLYMLIGSGVFAVAMVVSLLGLIYVRVVNSAFKEEKVKLQIVGPDNISVGDMTTYKLVVENKNRVDLQGAVLSVKIPDNFILQKNNLDINEYLSGAKIKIGDIGKFSKKEIDLKFKVIYSGDPDLFLKASVMYEPKNVHSPFSSSATKNIILSKASLDVLVLSPDTVSSGEEISFQVVVKNNQEKDYNNITLEMSSPKEFQSSSSIPLTVDGSDNKWFFPDIKAGDQKEVRVYGKLNGMINSVKQFTFRLLDEKGEELFVINKDVRIIPPKVLLRSIVKNDNIYPGDKVEYEVFFKNNFSTPLRNLILKVHLPDKYIIKEKVYSGKGYYDDRGNVIVWKAGDLKSLSNLQPGEEGKVFFSVPVKREILFDNGKNKNPSLSMFSEIDSLDIDSPVFENKKIISPVFKLPINSLMQIRGYITYLPEDNNGKQNGFLVAGKPVNLRVKLKVLNTTNDVRNVKLKAFFPSGIQWNRQIYPKGNNLEFNKRSGELKWNIGLVPAGTGFGAPAETAEFIITVTPSVNQVNNFIPLINKLDIFGKDIFTKNDISYHFNSIHSGLVKGLSNNKVINSEKNNDQNQPAEN